MRCETKRILVPESASGLNSSCCRRVYGVKGMETQSRDHTSDQGHWSAVVLANPNNCYKDEEYSKELPDIEGSRQPYVAEWNC
jgi:hypothetical protein